MLATLAAPPCVLTTWYPDDALHTAEAKATSVAIATQNRSQDFNFFFFLSK